MKKIAILSCVFLVASGLFAQETTPAVTGTSPAETVQASLPSVNIQDLEGKTINTSSFQNEGKPMVIDFWATWCKPCIRELDAISEHYEEWTAAGFKVITISIDDERTMSKVAPFVSGREWEYEVYLDPNSDFKRAMNVVNVPHTFVIDGKGNIVSQHTTFAAGDETHLFEELKKLAEQK